MRKNYFVLLLSLTMMFFLSIQCVFAENANPAADNAASESKTDEIIDTEAIPKAPETAPKEKEKFSYNAQGMRDPFVSLLDMGSANKEGLVGLAGMQIAELNLQGIQIGIGKLAIVEGSDKKVYAMHIGDSVLDGKLVDIKPNKVVFEKIIFDPFGRVKDKQLIEIYLH